MPSLSSFSQTSKAQRKWLWLAGLSEYLSWLTSVASAPKTVPATPPPLHDWSHCCLSTEGRTVASALFNGRLGVGKLASLPLHSLCVESRQGLLIPLPHRSPHPSPPPSVFYEVLFLVLEATETFMVY